MPVGTPPLNETEENMSLSDEMKEGSLEGSSVIKPEPVELEGAEDY